MVTRKEWGLPCHLHQHVPSDCWLDSGMHKASQIPAALFFGRNKPRDETYSHIWFDIRVILLSMSAQCSICLELEDASPASFAQGVTSPSLRWILQPWEGDSHSAFPFNSPCLQLLTCSLHFPYISTAQWDSHPVPISLWCSNHCTGHRRPREKESFFSEDTQHNRAGSAEEMLVHVAGAGMSWA